LDALSLSLYTLISVAVFVVGSTFSIGHARAMVDYEKRLE